jgi:hypothetical protein
VSTLAQSATQRVGLRPSHRLTGPAFSRARRGSPPDTIPRNRNRNLGQNPASNASTAWQQWQSGGLRTSVANSRAQRRPWPVGRGADIRLPFHQQLIQPADAAGLARCHRRLLVEVDAKLFAQEFARILKGRMDLLPRPTFRRLHICRSGASATVTARTAPLPPLIKPDDGRE